MSRVDAVQSEQKEIAAAMQQVAVLFPYTDDLHLPDQLYFAIKDLCRHAEKPEHRATIIRGIQSKIPDLIAYLSTPMQTIDAETTHSNVVRLLWNLLQDTHAENRKFISLACPIPKLIEMLGSRHTAMFAEETLYQLACDPDPTYRNEIISVEGIVDLLDDGLLYDRELGMSTQRLVCALIQDKATAVRPQILEKIKTQIPGLLREFQRVSDSPYSVDLLYALAQAAPANCVAMVNNDVIPWLIRSLIRPTRYTAVATNFLHLLTENGENHAQIITEGAIPHLLHLLQLNAGLGNRPVVAKILGKLLELPDEVSSAETNPILFCVRLLGKSPDETVKKTIILEWHGNLQSGCITVADLVAANALPLLVRFLVSDAPLHVNLQTAAGSALYEIIYPLPMKNREYSCNDSRNVVENRNGTEA